MVALPSLITIAHPDFSHSAKDGIVAVVEKCPNYIFHLMAVAEAGFTSDYADIYRRSISSEDASYIRKHKRLLFLQSGSWGELVPVMILFPAYINLGSADAFEEYFFLLDLGLRTGEFEAFRKRYASFNDKLTPWFPIQKKYLNSIRKHRETIDALGKLYVRNYPTYKKEVWQKEKSKLNQVAQKINNYFKNKDLITRWETLTRTKFKFNNYHIVLCSAIKNGPNANSLGYDRNVFYHDMPFDEMTQFISHETGTHILIEIYKEISRLNRFDSALLYGAYECLAKFYNTIILDNRNLRYQMPYFHEKEYLGIYHEIFQRDLNIAPRDLLIAGIEAFQDQDASIR